MIVLAGAPNRRFAPVETRETVGEKNPTTSDRFEHSLSHGLGRHAQRTSPRVNARLQTVQLLLTFISQGLPLVGQSLTLVGQPFALVRYGFAAVGRAVSVVCDRLPPLDDAQAIKELGLRLLESRPLLLAVDLGLFRASGT
jgi:hypothetical protein